jgi:predicted lipoprotein with Yx(FWY)xxD motif
MSRCAALAVGVAAALVAAGCGSGGTETIPAPKKGAGGSPATRASQTPYASASPEASAGASIVPSTVTVRRTRLGRILTDGGGRTLYVFERDRGRRSSCYGSCAQLWPPFTTTTDAVPAAAGVSQRLLGSSQRTDRIDGVTYAGHPLYFYGFDAGPGDLHGQGVQDFGGRWWAISPSGRVIRSR